MTTLLKPLTNRIEILFWDIFNNSLSQSKTIRKSIQYMNDIEWIEKPRKYGTTLSFLAVTGFISGIALAFLIYR